MKKLNILIILGIFISILGMSAEQRITIKPGSYCKGLKEVADIDDDEVDINELYFFDRCLINGKTYRIKTTWGDGDVVGARLRIYFNSFQQLNNTTNKISKKDRVYFIPGETMVKETDSYNGETIWSINVKKIQIK